MHGQVWEAVPIAHWKPGTWAVVLGPEKTCSVTSLRLPQTSVDRPGKWSVWSVLVLVETSAHVRGDYMLGWQQVFSVLDTNLSNQGSSPCSDPAPSLTAKQGTWPTWSTFPSSCQSLTVFSALQTPKYYLLVWILMDILSAVFIVAIFYFHW